MVDGEVQRLALFTLEILQRAPGASRFLAGLDIVEALIEGVGEAQMSPSGQLPSTQGLKPIDHFALKIALPRDANAKAMVFGASGLAAINTGKGADVFWLLRRLEIQSESYLNYLYNPFRG